MRDPFLMTSQSYSPPSSPLQSPSLSYSHLRGQDSPLIAVAAVIVVVLIALCMMGTLWLCCRKAMACFCPTWTPFPHRRSFSVQASVLDDQLMPIPTGDLETGPVLEVLDQDFLPIPTRNLVRAVVPIPIGDLEIRPKIFSYEELATASNGFTRLLGVGGYGEVYEGNIGDSKVAIKRLIDASSTVSIAGFLAEVTTLSCLRHRNIVPLIGWCQDNNEWMLVYELMPKGSLDSYLDPKNPVLPWSTRYTIALDLAHALAYIHEDFDRDNFILHRDIKPQNIMIGNYFDARLGDFGLAGLIEHDQRTHMANMVGTFGYMDPYSMGDVKSDMFSFGVVLLEMASGRRPIIEVEGEGFIHIGVFLLRECCNGVEPVGLADPRLQGNFVRTQLNAVIRVGLWCVQQEPRMRLSAKEALKALKMERSLEIPVDTPDNTHGSSVSRSSIFVNTSCASWGRRDGRVFSTVSESPFIADTRDFQSDRSSLSDNTSGLSSGSLVVTGRRGGRVFSTVSESHFVADTHDFYSDRSSLSDNTSGLSSDDSDGEIFPALFKDYQLLADLGSDSSTAALNNGVVAPVPSPKLATRRQKVILEENRQKVETINRILEIKAKYFLGHSPTSSLQTWREAFNLKSKAKEE